MTSANHWFPAEDRNAYTSDPLIVRAFDDTRPECTPILLTYNPPFRVLYGSSKSRHSLISIQSGCRLQACHRDAVERRDTPCLLRCPFPSQPYNRRHLPVCSDARREVSNLENLSAEHDRRAQRGIFNVTSEADCPSMRSVPGYWVRYDTRTSRAPVRASRSRSISSAPPGGTSFVA